MYLPFNEKNDILLEENYLGGFLMSKQKNYSFYYIIFTFLASFLPRFILCLFAYPADFPGDEVTAAASAATAYGLDWSNVLSIGRYYGQGFTILFTPVYYITNNPIIIFRIMTMTFAFLQALGGVIAFHCLKKYFNVNNYIYLSICSIGCSYLLESRATIISNEHPLQLICWLIVWILLILDSCIDNKKKRIKYTIILVLVLVYSLTLHTRAITLWLALGVCVIFYFWVYRKWIVSLPVFAFLGISGTVVGGIVIAYVQKAIWATNGATTLDNSHFNIDLSNFLKLKDVTSWQAWLSIIIGQLNTVSIITCGMAVTGIVVLCTIFWQALLRRSEILNGTDSSMLARFILIGSFFSTAVILTLGGQSISWLPYAAEGMIAGFGSKGFGFKAFLYFRYFALYTGPLFMLTFAYVYLYKNKIMSYCKTATIVMLLLQAYFTICIVPYIYNFQEYTTTKFRPFILFLTGNKTNIYTFLGASFVVIFIWIITWLSYHKKNILIPALIITSILIYQYVSLTIHYDYNKQVRHYASVNSSYKLMTDLENNQAIPKDIYVIPHDNSTSTAQFFIYQFYLNNYKVSPWLPDATLPEGIAFYDKPDYEYLIQLGYQCIQLDNNEYIYVKGESLLSIVSDAVAINLK